MMIMDSSNDFKKLSRPNIEIDEDLIVISDPPIGWRIFLTLLWCGLTWMAFLEGGDEYLMGVFVCGAGVLAFLYDALSLNRVRVDLKNKVIFRTTLNPLGNLLDRILQHPSAIPLDKITKFEVDYPIRGFSGVSRWYLLVEYDGIYKLQIGIFKKVRTPKM